MNDTLGGAVKVLAQAFHPDEPNVVRLTVNLEEIELFVGASVEQIEEVLGQEFIRFGQGLREHRLAGRVADWMRSRGLLQAPD